MKQMHDLYNKLYLEKHRSKTMSDAAKNYNFNTSEEIENRMKQYISDNFNVLDKVDLAEGDEDTAWDKVFDVYKEKTH